MYYCHASNTRITKQSFLNLAFKYGGAQDNVDVRENVSDSDGFIYIIVGTQEDV